MTSRISLRYLRQKAQAASSGEWAAFENGPWGSQGYGISITDDSENWFIVNNSGEPSSSNAKYIAAANPATVIALCDALEKAREALKPFASVGLERSLSVDDDSTWRFAFEGRDFGKSAMCLKELDEVFCE